MYFCHQIYLCVFFLQASSCFSKRGCPCTTCIIKPTYTVGKRARMNSVPTGTLSLSFSPLFVPSHWFYFLLDLRRSRSGAWNRSQSLVAGASGSNLVGFSNWNWGKSGIQFCWLLGCDRGWWCLILRGLARCLVLLRRRRRSSRSWLGSQRPIWRKGMCFALFPAGEIFSTFGLWLFYMNCGMSCIGVFVWSFREICCGWFGNLLKLLLCCFAISVYS